LKINQDAWIYRVNLETGKTVEHTLHSRDHGAYIFVIDGKVKAGSQVLNKRDALGFSDTESVDVMAEENSDILIFEVPMEM
jgi:redox-sensitive bicupin YhaK (pirin superfamily)